jgi:hypothetical protein
MEIVRKLYLRSWRGVALAVSLAIIAYLLYFHRLGSLLPGYSQPELNALAGASNWHNIFDNPIDAPYKVIVWLFTAVMHHGIIVTRVVAACYGLFVGLLFFAVARAWCSYRAAFLATIMFVTSAGLLHFARLGTGAILQMGILTLLAIASWYRGKRQHRKIIGYLLIAFFVLLWYIPGMIWLVLLAILPFKNTIRKQLGRTKKIHLAGLVLVFVVCLAPLAVACIRKPRLLLQVGGLPQSLSSAIHFVSNAWDTVLAIVVHSNGSPVLWVGHAPLLSAIEVILGIMGAYYIFREASGRSTFLFGSAAVGLALTALGGGVTIAYLIPILYLFIATGLDHLLGEWLNVFPRNPVARATGTVIICIMIAFSIFYQLRSYYVAWPNAPATRQAFNHKPS